ncbi:hypothetical protein ACL2XG_17280 [Sodalis sp. RH24]|uniref:hypothetical protein n=1 Tax=unclassified Sodalis (in: enterobacteria) TaxID=2636512 RepID=UPI0039B53F2C
MMDQIASPYLKEFITLRSLSAPQPAKALTRIASHFARIQNCCERCATLWERWNQEVAKMEDGMLTAPHPPARMLHSMQARYDIAERLVSAADENILGVSLLVTDLHEKQLLDHIFALAGRKKQHEQKPEERAATHLFAKLLMRGLLDEFLHAKFHQAQLERSRCYEPLLNGLYPFRRSDDTILKIKSISADSKKVVSGKVYANDGVKPFITSTTAPLARLKLYAQVMLRHAALDKPSRPEAEAAPQWRVMARSPIAKDTCVGVLSGTLVDEYLMAHRQFFNMEYIVDISVCGGPDTYLDSDGILAKIRAGFAYDDPRAAHKPAAKSCNVEAAKFLAELADGRKIYVLAIFALRNIAAGEELRIYSLTPPEYNTTADNRT